MHMYLKDPFTAVLGTSCLFNMLYRNEDNLCGKRFYSNFVPISITLNFILYPTSQIL